MTAAAARSAGPALRPWAAEGAIDVEKLAIWAFRDQRADRLANMGLYVAEASAAGLETPGRSGDGCSRLADIAHLGCRVQSTRMISDAVHPVADLVATMVQSIEHGELVSYHAALGGRPDGWSEPERWFRPVVWKVEGRLAQSERSGPGTSHFITRVMPVTSRSEIHRRRVCYGQWWEALDQLAWRLSTRNLGFTVRHPSAPRSPWLDAASA